MKAKKIQQVTPGETIPFKFSSQLKMSFMSGKKIPRPMMNALRTHVRMYPLIGSPAAFVFRKNFGMYLVPVSEINIRVMASSNTASRAAR